MLSMIALSLALAGGFFAFGFARGFVRRKLRFVDAVHGPLVPVVAAVVGAIVVLPLTLLPLITGFTAALVGVGAGLGTASGAKALKRGE